jgi:hypothetical protein
MSTTVWTVIAVLGTIALVPPPAHSPEPHAPPSLERSAGGKPDTLVVNPRASSIRWKGTGLGGRAVREGTMGIGKGMFVVRHEQLTSGIVTFDMTRLDGALKGETFFDVAHHPSASFTSTGMTRVGQSRWQVSGNLTLRGVSRPVTFDADVRWEELGHMIATSSFMIDRTQWGIGGGAAVADGLADPAIQLSVTLDAQRKQPTVVTR